MVIWRDAVSTQPLGKNHGLPMVTLPNGLLWEGTLGVQVHIYIYILSTYKYVYIYVCVYICIYIYMYTYIYICTHTHIYIYIDVVWNSCSGRFMGIQLISHMILKILDSEFWILVRFSNLSFKVATTRSTQIKGIRRSCWTVWWFATWSMLVSLKSYCNSIVISTTTRFLSNHIKQCKETCWWRFPKK